MEDWVLVVGMGASLLGAGFALGCLVVVAVVRATEPPAEPVALDLDAERPVELAPDWRLELARTETDAAVMAAASMQTELMVARADAESARGGLADAQSKLADARARLNGLHRFLRAHGFTAWEVRKWLQGSRGSS